MVDELAGGAPAPAEWLAPPMYLWAPRAGVWRPTLELPPVGQAYYCPSGHWVRR